MNQEEKNEGKDLLRVLLLEDDTSICEEFVNYVETLDDVILVGVTNSSYKALDIIKDTLPDAAVLDLELHNGSGNGLLLLNDLRQLDPSIVPYTVIATNNSSATTYESARQLGADFIFSKHQEDYSPKTAINFLRIMRAVIKNRRKTAAHLPESSTADSREVLAKRMIKRICTELNNLGVSSKALGYQYLADAILLAVEGPSSNLSTVIGRKYGKTAASVERAMQNAIERTWNSEPLDVLTANYTARINPERGTPTVMEFVYFYSTKIKNDY